MIECVASPDGSVQQRFDGFVRSVRMFANQAAEEFGSDRRRVRPISGASKFLWYRLFLRSGSPQNVYLLPQHPNFHLKHDASLDPGLWPNAIESICGYVGAASASLHSQDSVSRATDALFWWGRESSAPHYFDLYLQKYGKINPIFPGVVFFDVELPVAVPDVISCEEFVQTRFFREWLAPQSLMDGLFSNLEKGATSCALFTAMRHAEQGQVDDRMRRRFELITPHVRRAMLIGKVIDLHRVEAAALADSLDELASGMFIVDQSGRIIHANASAHRLIAEANVLRATNGRVAALDLEGNRNLLDIFMAAQAGDAAVGKRGIALPLKALSGERYVAHVLPLTSGARRKAGVSYSATAAMFVRKAALDLPSPPEAVADEFNLTPAEVRVMFAIVEIGGVPEVAPVLGISDQTVKTHLHRIYEKTATKRQADLVKLVASYSGRL